MTVDTGALGADTGEQSQITRREFLNYAWLASLGVFTAQILVLSYQFAMPRIQAGDFGGPVPLGSVDALVSDPASGPEPFPRAKFWWVALTDGVKAIYTVCTHLGCIYSWKDDQVRFICPCHGSQFQKDGEFILGPAPRSLDQFVIRAYDEGGTLVAETNENGDPLQIPEGSRVVVETGMRILGEPK